MLPNDTTECNQPNWLASGLEVVHDCCNFLQKCLFCKVQLRTQVIIFLFENYFVNMFEKKKAFKVATFRAEKWGQQE